MYKRYKKQGYPTEFPVRTKCILLFQTIHGVDVLIFGMYVYEYNHDCPAPNRGRVYISYLDSVHYFQPREYRTSTYQTILIEYLRYVKERGFHTAHIWSCPPSKGDDYIFHLHPPQQKTPCDDMLCNWYQTMLATAESEGVVLKTKTLYDEYFKPEGNKLFSLPTCIPYFEGDYIPGEVENIIKDLSKEEEERCKQKERDTFPGAIKLGEKVVGNKRGTRSNPGELVNVDPDKVMNRLGQALSHIKQNFFVIYLRSRAFADAVDRGEDVSDWPDDEYEVPKDRNRNVGKDASILGDSRAAKKFITTDTDSADNVPDDSATGPQQVVNPTALEETPNSEMKIDEDSAAAAPSESALSGSIEELTRMAVEEAKGNVSPSQDAGLSANDLSSSDADGVNQKKTRRVVGSTIDTDPPVESELFDSRQQLLNFCQSNHFQFDELRRAKYSTLMVCSPVSCSTLFLACLARNIAHCFLRPLIHFPQNTTDALSHSQPVCA